MQKEAFCLAFKMKDEAKPLAEAEILKVMTKATKSAAAAILVSWLVSEAAWSEWACQVGCMQGLLEFIWTEGYSGRSSNPDLALAILVLWYK